MSAPRLDDADLHTLLNAVDESTWKRFTGCRLFLTGGTGFVGCWLLEALLQADTHYGLGMRVTLLSRRPDAFASKAPHLACHPSVTLIKGDVCDLGALELQCDMVIHAATDVEKPGNAAVSVFDAIVDGTRSVLAFTARSGAKRFLYLSSGAVYGKQPPDLLRIPETHSSAPDEGAANAAYALGKRVSEWLVAQAAAACGFEAVHARLFALLGPYIPLDAHFAAGNFIADAIARRPVMVSGNGAPVRSYIYGADMAVWLINLLAYGRSGTAYNVGSEEAISILDLAKRVASLADCTVQVTDTRPANGLAPRYVPDTQLARSLNGLSTFTDLQTALVRTLRWAQRAAA